MPNDSLLPVVQENRQSLVDERPFITDNPQAIDSALLETAITGVDSEYPHRVRQNLIGNGAFGAGSNAIGNEVFQGFKDSQIAGTLGDNAVLLGSLEGFDTPEKKQQYIEETIALTDLREADLRWTAAVYFMRQAGYNAPKQVFDQWYSDLSYGQLELLKQDMVDNQRAGLRRAVETIVAEQGWDSNTEATFDIAIQELVPFQNVGLKIYFLGKMMDFMGVPDEARPLTKNIGDGRQLLRDTIKEKGPAAVTQDLKALHKWLKDLQKDPAMSKVFREFLVLEQFEAVFTEELLTGGTSIDNFDKWFGRLETAAEVVASGFIIRGAKRSIQNLLSAFRASERSVLTKAAREAGNRTYQTELESVIQGNTAKQLGIDPGEAALNRMPRPQTLVDDRTIHLPGVEDALTRADTLAGEIMKAHSGNVGRLFNNAERQALANDEIRKLQLGDHARVAPAMSTIQDMDDGVMIRAVISKNGESAYKNFDELVTEIMVLDPNMEVFTILRRGRDGTLEPIDVGAEELARIVTNNPENLSDAVLTQKLNEANRAGRQMEFLQLEREATRRSGEESVSGILDDEYFLQYEHFRPYHPTDKVAFGADTIRHTAIPFTVLAPNAKFGDEIAGAFIGSAPQEARIVRLFNDLYKPYFKLNAKSKRNVAAVFEWGEDWAKTNGKDPDLYEILSQFPDLTPKEISGLVAVRRGLDTQYDVLNRRLWLEWQGLGYRTASSVDPSKPRFHGKTLLEEEARGSTFYDPVNQEMVTLGAKEKAQFYADGGQVIKLDTPMDVPGTNGRERATLILADGDEYRVGELARDPLERYPGFRYRFYEDPYYIVKKQGGVTVDGVARAATSEAETAIRTAGSQIEGENFLNRAFLRTVDRNGTARWVDETGAEYSVVRARDIDQTDNVLKQKEALQREGRLFWDARNRDALLDTNGNTSEILDFTLALERGTSLAARLNTHEDMLRTLRHALIGEFNLPELSALKASVDDISTVVSNLRKGMNNAADPTLRRTYKEALEVAKYIRQLEGVDSPAVGFMRSQILRTAVWADRLLNNKGFKAGKFKNIEKWAQGVDPLRAMRSTAFGLFMVLRPLKQLTLQASQPLFLAGIDPLYVLSGRGLSDTLVLRSGFGALRHANYVEDGMSIAGRAKLMGLSQKEFRHLVKKLDESGSVDVVDIHSFSGGTRRWHQIQPHDGSIGSRALYGTKKFGSMTFHGLKTFGFDMGEEINKVATFNIAWRRVMKEKEYKSLLELTDNDWKRVFKDTENLSFAMTKPGAFQYQSGLLSVTTQFISFTHKMALALLAQNPALSGKEVAKIWAAMFGMYGTNMFGLRDYTEKTLLGMGFDDTFMNSEIPGVGGTPLDLISAGVIQQAVNKVGSMSVDDWKELDTSAVGPIFNAQQFYEMMLEGVIKLDPEALFGPFGNRFSALLDTMEFTRNTSIGMQDLPIGDQLPVALDMWARGLVPQYNDLTASYFQYKYGKMMSTAGNPLHIRPAWNSIIARGLFGVRTMEENDFYWMENLDRDSDKLVDDMIKSGRKYMTQYIRLYRQGDISRDLFQDVGRMVGHLAQQAPPGRVEEVVQGIMLPYYSDDDPTLLPAYLLAEHVRENHSLSVGEAKALLNSFDMTDQQRAQLNQFIEESYENVELSQEEMRQRIIQRNPNIR